MVFFMLAAGLLTAFSTAILLYVSFATGLGPWIGPMLVLICRLGMWRGGVDHKRITALLTIIASYGGAIATGVGFSLTTLYFIDPATWQSWMENPLWFCMFMGLLVLSAGLFGVALAWRTAPGLLADESIPFPVSTAITSAIDEAHGYAHNLFFGGGVGLAALLGLLRERYYALLATIPLELAPTCWAAGFLAGSTIIMPLLVGMAAKYAVLAPVWWCAQSISWGGLSSLQMPDITFAFCTGILLSGLLKSYAFRPRVLAQYSHNAFHVLRRGTAALQHGFGMELCAALAMAVICWSLGMPFVALLPFLIFLAPLLEHLGNFAVRTGLATYGRYMTLVMLPLLCIPGVSSVQIVIVCTLVGIAGAAMVDTLFSYKIGQHFHIAEQRLRYAHIAGVFATALTVGFLVWVLCTHFTLGQAPLMAHRGISRALLMQSFQFNWIIVFLGLVFGLILEQLKVNAVMVFGGLIMPNGLIIALALGAAVRMVTQRVSSWTLFWSGALAGDVLWVLFSLAKF